MVCMWGTKGHEESIDFYLANVKAHLIQIIREKIQTNNQKIQLDIGIKFFDEETKKQFVQYVNTDNITSSPQNNEAIITYELTNDLKDKIEIKTKNIGEESGYFYDGNEALHIHFRKLDLNCGASYINLPKWLEKKVAVVNPQNHNDIHCFAYANIIALFNEELGAHPERINDNLKRQMERLNFKDIKFPASCNDYHTFEKNNEDVALNTFFLSKNSKKVKQEYISKHNFTKHK